MENSKVEEMANQERREYFKQWRAKNPDKVKQHNQTYWAKRALRKKAELEVAQNGANANNTTTSTGI